MMHLSSYYSEDSTLRAEVHRVDEMTYVTIMAEDSASETREKRVYFGNLQDAENAAEDFVERI